VGGRERRHRVPAHPAVVPAPSPSDLDQRALEQEPGPATDRVAARRADALLALITGTGEVVERGQPR
jgi:hypothetical protein